MKILRVFNNNVVLATGARGEVIATGRGLGFGARAGDVLDDAKIHRLFIPADGRDPDHLGQLLAEIPIELLTLAADALRATDLPEASLTSPTLLMGLADHLHFALERAQTRTTIAYPLLSEVQHLYAREYAQARTIVAYVNDVIGRRGQRELPEDEAVAITLHLVNAGFSTGDLSFTYTMTGVLQQLIDAVGKSFGIDLETSTVNVGRFITHLRYLFVRIHQHAQLDSEPSTIAHAIRTTHPEAYRCARDLATLIEIRMGAELTEDEITYLTLHVARIVEVAGPSRSETALSREVTVPAGDGLQARAAGLLADTAAASGLPVQLSYGSATVDATSALAVMGLGVPGEARVRLSSPDPAARPLIDALAALIAAGA
ncbi:hypothetical protein C3B44_08150 [Corynebacterium yudongzhengii]|uniref:PRD domain-containing protein n=1 Tax=Corynebacterium yudongzhengii TaxID=2080740 RepID=UPI000D350352|nr:PRD domain-containing protein [Corynebacterium yudongzhengii]AWB82329.1 hypothetical protein C3B44_08150 [Corynebacterium yudongzhengii]